jgi:heat shock protein HslJ
MSGVTAVRFSGWATAAVCFTVVAGCSSTPQPRTLEGTSWRLTAIESMNDAQGVTPFPGPGVFTVRFGDDGRAAFQLDCNSGSGTYDAQPTGDGTTGALTFGPIATTLTGCPGESLDQKVSAALPHVRGYIFKGEQLHMSLMFDGGILSWEPDTG